MKLVLTLVATSLIRVTTEGKEAVCSQSFADFTRLSSPCVCATSFNIFPRIKLLYISVKETARVSLPLRLGTVSYTRHPC